MGKQEWIQAVASGETELSFAEWQAAVKDGKKYICGYGTITVGVVVDMETKEIVRVVAEDDTLSHPCDFVNWTYMDSQFVETTPPPMPEVSQAIEVMTGQRTHWPEWDWSW
jgi:hypothetical protein